MQYFCKNCKVTFAIAPLEVGLRRKYEPSLDHVDHVVYMPDYDERRDRMICPICGSMNVVVWESKEN